MHYDMKGIDAMTPDFKKYFGKDVPILSGAIHYFRVHPAYWHDRLAKLAACGLNTVETYVPWNLHEPKKGQYSFDGFGDLPAFIETADKLGLKVIIRPGPYICTEWDLGGLPAWLLADRHMRLRCSWPPYLEEVRKWFSVLIPKLVPYLISKGGPIIAMQVENEYGSYGHDKAYLAYIRDLLREFGVDSLLFTADGTGIQYLEGGSLPGLWITANFGSKPDERFKDLRVFQPDGPDMCCEYWCGWFDHWGNKHYTRDAADVARVLEEMVAQGASVNMYMYHGGTNFGFWNGANTDGESRYNSTTTSYDYSAPLSEAGDMTPTYFACKEVLEKHFGKAPEIQVANTKKKAYGAIELASRVSLWNCLGEGRKSPCLLTMDELGQEYGYVFYRTNVSLPQVPRQHLESQNYKQELTISGLRDRATVYVDGKFVGALHRNEPSQVLVLPMPPADRNEFQLDILVENMGRVNYGHEMEYLTGISGFVRIGSNALFDWEIFSLPLQEPMTGKAGAAQDSAAFYHGSFEAETVQDTFLNCSNFKKGVAYINGFNLGRYWEVGPARTLYIPAPLLTHGKNEIVLFETDGLNGPATVELCDSHLWKEPISK